MQFLKSRTFWTLVIMFVINGISAIHDSIPANVVGILDLVLAGLGTYFHVNPARTYTQG